MYALFLGLLVCLSMQAIEAKEHKAYGDTMDYEIVALQRTDLAQKVSEQLHKELIIPEFRRFADGEVNVQLADYERYAGKTVVIMQSTGRGTEESIGVNEYTLGVAFLAQELKNAGAHNVIAVTPYFGYARQEKGSIPDTPGHAQVVAKLFEASGIDEFIAVELHDESIIDLFTIPVTNISVRKTIGDAITKQFADLDSVCLVAPDKGAQEYVKEVAKLINVGTITFSKERFATDQTRVLGCVSECDGIIGVVIDDIISTGGTAINVCGTLPQMGYSSVYGYFVHPVLAANAVERMQNSCFNSIFVSNSLPLAPDMNGLPFITVFDISGDIVSVLKDKLTEK